MIKKVIIAKDLEPSLKQKLKEKLKNTKVEIEESDKTREELSRQLGKPFLIGCIGLGYKVEKRK